MKIVIVSNSFEAPGARALSAAATALGYEAVIVKAGDDTVALSIAESDRVIYRLGPKSYRLFVDLVSKISGPHKTLLDATLASFDKLSTYSILIHNNIPTPFSSEIGRDDIVESYPVVAKILNGNQGVGIALINSDNELSDYKNEFPNEEKFLVQEFIKESSGTDTRLFVVGERVVAAMKRVAETGDFRANLHLGARIEAYSPSEEEEAIAMKAVKAFGLKYAGVDIISSNRGPLVLEVNPSPGFGIQEVNDVDVAAEVIKGVVND